MRSIHGATDDLELHRRTPKGTSPSPESPALVTQYPRGLGSMGLSPSMSPQYIAGEGVAGALVSGMQLGHRSPPVGMRHWEASRNSMSAVRTDYATDRFFPPTQSYMPPPPLRQAPTGCGRRNIFDYDTNGEAGPAMPAAPANADATVYGSISPLMEARFGYLTLENRPASATVVRGSPSRGIASYGGGVASPAALHRTSSTVAFVPSQMAKPRYTNNCGVLVESVNPKTGALSQYRCGAFLGKGGFATVYEFTEVHTKSIYACKIIDRAKLGSTGEDKVLMEVEIHRRMQHPNVLRLYSMFSDDFYFYILLERCNNKNLMDVCNERGALPVAEVQHIMRQLTAGVGYLHGQKVVHRDIKLGNIMMDFSGNVKIGDFGFASLFSNPSEKKMRMCGTPNYIAPEILEYHNTKKGYGFEVDIWSLGVLLYILAFGSPPFESRDVESTYDRVRRIDYRFPSSSPSSGAVPEPCKDLIRSMLQRDPSARPKPSQVLESPFLYSARMERPWMGDYPSSGTFTSLCSPSHVIDARMATQLPQPATAPARQADTRGETQGYPMPARNSRSPIVGPPVLCMSPCSGTGDGRSGDISPLSHPRSDIYSGATSPSQRAGRNSIHDQGSAVPTATGMTRREENEFWQLQGVLHAAGMGELEGARRTRDSPAHDGVHIPNRNETILPSPPPAFFRTSLYAKKYGHCLTLNADGDEVFAFSFNDNTKFTYDEAKDRAIYYDRVRALTNAGNHDTPVLNNEELLEGQEGRKQLFGGRDDEAQRGGSPAKCAARMYIDEPHYYEPASEMLRPGPTAGSSDSSTRANPYSSPEQKKFGIAKFLIPFLINGNGENTFPVVRSTIKHLGKEVYHRLLFSGAPQRRRTSPDREAALTSVFVKEVVTRKLSEVDPSYAGVDVTLTAVRFSNQTFQVSVQCTSICPLSLVPTTESAIVSRGSRWKLDVLVYPPFQALIGIETEHSLVLESFYDLHRDCVKTEDATQFLAAGSTSDSHWQFTFPKELLRIIVIVLASVKCPKNTQNCFYPLCAV